MKKVTIFLLTLCMFLAGCSATGNSQTEQIEYDFRNVNWGMTLEEVIDSEGREPDNTLGKSDFIEYEDVMFEDLLPMKLTYDFNSSHLFAAGYSMNFYIKDDNSDYLLEKVTQIQNKITEKYNEPVSIMSTLPEKIVKSDRIFYTVLWESDNTVIKLQLNKKTETREAIVTINYTCKSDIDSKEE